MELYEAFETIDAILGMFKSFESQVEGGELKEDFLFQRVSRCVENVVDEEMNFEIQSREYYTYVDCDTEYRMYIVDIRPVCIYMINEWPSIKAKKIRKELKQVFQNCLEICAKLFGEEIDTVVEEGYTYDKVYNTGSYDIRNIGSVMQDTIHEMSHALKLTDESIKEKQEEELTITEKSASEMDWVRLTDGFNLDKIREVVKDTGKSNEEKRIVVKAIFDTIMSVDKLYNVPYAVDRLIMQLYSEYGGNIKDLSPTQTAQKSFFIKSKIPKEIAESEDWKKLMTASIIDENGNPRLSRTEAAILADILLERMGKDHEWTLFERMWGRKNMRIDFQTAQNLVKYESVRKKILHVLN